MKNFPPQVNILKTLYLKVFSMLVGYLLLLFAIGFIAFNSTFGVGWETLLASPLGERIATVANGLSGQLRNTPRSDWNEILRSTGEIYHVDFSIFDSAGSELAQSTESPHEGQNAVPRSVLERLRMLLPPGPHMFGVFAGLRKAYDGGGPETVRVFDGRVINGRPPGEPSFAGPPVFFHHSSASLPELDGFASLDEPEIEMKDFAPSFEIGTFEGPDKKDILTARGPLFERGRFIEHTHSPDRFWIATRMAIFENTGQDESGISHWRLRPAVLLASTDNIWGSSILIDFSFIGIIALVLLLLSIVFWYPFVYGLATAVRQLTLATENIADGNFDVLIANKRQDELGRLAEAVNTLAKRLNGFVVGQKRFLGDISHELRSPIARLQMALEILDASKNLGDEERKHIEDIREEVVEMTQLVDELLAFSKAGLKGQAPNMVRLELSELVGSVIERLGIKGRCDVKITDAGLVLCDRNLLERALSNVLRNCIRYAGEDSRIGINALSKEEAVVLTVSDRGPGVAEEALVHLGEPFYRPESSRSRSLGGVGLGLAIVRACVEACGGKVSIRNGESGGLEVELALQKAA